MSNTQIYGAFCLENWSVGQEIKNSVPFTYPKLSLPCLQEPVTRALRQINPLNAELNPICHFPALLGAHLIFHVSRVRVNTFSILFT